MENYTQRLTAQKEALTKDIDEMVEEIKNFEDTFEKKLEKLKV